MNRSYYAIIPADVRYDDKVTANAKLLFGEITALTNEKGYCWASNNYFAELYKVEKGTISRWISQLEKNNHISTALIYKEGTKEVDKRIIKIKHTYKQNKGGGMNNIVKDIHTIYDNNNTKEYSVKSKKPNKKVKSFSDFPEDIQKSFLPICDLFPKETRPKTTTQKRNWCNAIDELNRINKISPRKLYLLIKKIREDDFWSKQILSVLKLRKSKEGITYADKMMYQFGKEIKDVQI
tara:strand:+ start:11692 stop:12402 length:711 start_codon:yes stop_codon:yes gene_type:complete